MAPTKPQSEEQPVKRGRGRPPKDPSERKTVPQPSGRPRGRPKGSGGVKKAPQKTAASTGSRRGRPPKAAATPVAAKEKAAAPKATPSSTGRGRGRPRKSDVSEAATPSSKKATPKKGGPGRRGRPPKAVTEKFAEEEDVEEAAANEEDADEAEKAASDAASDVDEAASDEHDNNFKDAFGDVDMTLNGLDPDDIEATGEEVRMSTSNPQGSFSLNGILGRLWAMSPEKKNRQKE